MESCLILSPLLLCFQSVASLMYEEPKLTFHSDEGSGYDPYRYDSAWVRHKRSTEEAKEPLEKRSMTSPYCTCDGIPVDKSCLKRTNGNIPADPSQTGINPNYVPQQGGGRPTNPSTGSGSAVLGGAGRPTKPGGIEEYEGPKGPGGNGDYTGSGGSNKPEGLGGPGGSMGFGLKPATNQGNMPQGTGGGYNPMNDKPAGSYIPMANKPAGGYIPMNDKPAGGYIPMNDKPAGSYIPMANKPAGGYIPMNDKPAGSYIPMADKPTGGYNSMDQNPAGAQNCYGGVCRNSKCPGFDLEAYDQEQKNGGSYNEPSRGGENVDSQTNLGFKGGLGNPVRVTNSGKYPGSGADNNIQGGMLAGQPDDPNHLPGFRNHSYPQNMGNDGGPNGGPYFGSSGEPNSGQYYGPNGGKNGGTNGGTNGGQYLGSNGAPSGGASGGSVLGADNFFPPVPATGVEKYNQYYGPASLCSQQRSNC